MRESNEKENLSSKPFFQDDSRTS